MPDAPRPQIPDLPPAAGRPVRDRHAFLWTFGVCVALPVAGGAPLMVANSLESTLAAVAVYTLMGSLLAWVLAFVAGLGARIAGHAAVGNGMMLGALAGSGVGFALCSGVMAVADGLL